MCVGAVCACDVCVYVRAGVVCIHSCVAVAYVRWCAGVVLHVVRVSACILVHTEIIKINEYILSLTTFVCRNLFLGSHNLISLNMEVTTT